MVIYHGSRIRKKSPSKQINESQLPSPTGLSPAKACAVAPLPFFLLATTKNGVVPSKIEWDLTNGPRLVSCDQATRYAGFFGVRSVGPVGDFLD